MQNVQRHFRTHTCKEIAKDIPSSLLSLGSENMKKVYMFDHMFGGFFFFLKESERERFEVPDLKAWNKEAAQISFEHDCF